MQMMVAVRSLWYSNQARYAAARGPLKHDMETYNEKEGVI